jgi:hypothetical protein
MQVRRRLLIPAVLAATAIGAAPSCEGGKHHSLSGEDECYDILDMSTCAAETAFECRWDAALSECVPNCEAYEDASSCNHDDSCAWTGTACGLNEA